MQQENNHSDKSAQALLRTFTETARRQQIIEATIATLAEQGFGATSFVTISRRINVSRGLISYHFDNKNELLQETYRTIYAARAAAIDEALAQATTQTERLTRAIEADLRYLGGHPERFRALIEIVFNVRGERGLVFLGELHDATSASVLSILQAGRVSGEFGDFDARSVAMIIDGAKDQFFGQILMDATLDPTVFAHTLINLVLTAIKQKA